MNLTEVKRQTGVVEQQTMIKANRYLIIASTIGIIAILCLMLLYRQLAMSNLVEHETRGNVALTQVLSKVIWTRYQALTSAAADDNKKLGKEHPAIRQLDAEVKQMMRGSKLVKVKIFNLDGLTVFSTDPSQINQDKRENSGFRSARAGQPASNITFRDQFDAFEGSVSDINVVSSYIPITGQSNEIEAVFEVYSDVTDLIRQMQRQQWYIFFGVLGSVAILYFLLISSSRRADQIEAVRFEEASLSQAQIHYQTYHHAITDLPNRLNFTERLEQALAMAQKHNTLLSVIFIDIDRFKLVNDSFGLSSGDALLRLIGDRLSNCIRVNDSLFHMGGDEFTLLMENLKDSDSPARLAKRVADAMKAPFIINDQPIIVTLSLGIAIHDENDSNAAKLSKNAEAAMYLVKAVGGNQMRYYTPELDRHAQEQLIFESALQQALPNREFVLHYQPRLAADETSLVGFEALIRWQRNDASMVAPNDFIPVLEMNGLIRDVGQWVLGEACRQCKAWQDQGYDPLRISVNVSPLQFREGGFVEQVEDVLAATGLDASYLELELTESALLDDPQAAINTMEKLRDMGVTLSLDDFGTGYSSLS